MYAISTDRYGTGFERNAELMPRDPRHDILFEPVPIGPKTMRNRFYQSPHCTSFGADMPGAQAHIRGDEGRGRLGGGQHRVLLGPPLERLARRSSRRGSGTTRTRATSRAMADLAHEHGALAGVELWHGGCVAGNLETRLPAARRQPDDRRRACTRRAATSWTSAASARSRATTSPRREARARRRLRHRQRPRRRVRRDHRSTS